MKHSLKTFLRYFMATLLLAAINYGGASLGKLLAIPPGNVTPVWPPSGIGFAALLLFGNRLWPGIFIGSLAFNLGFFYQEHQFISVNGFICSLGIATGSTLQALAGSVVTKRFTRYNNDNWDIASVFKILVLSGPIACLIGATFGTTSLTLFQAIPRSEYWSTWATWWFGDSAGVFVVSGFLISAYHQIQSRKALNIQQPRTVLTSIASILLVLTVLGGTLWIWTVLRNETAEAERLHFENHIQEAEAEIKTRLLTYENALDGALGFIQASQGLNRIEWEAYTKALHIQEKYPGILGMGYIEYLIGDSIHNDRFVIKYIEPIERNIKALGYDIGSEVRRRKAAELARDTNTKRITQPVNLVQDVKQGPGFLLLLPIYDKNKTLATVADRRKAFKGWVYAPFTGKHIFENILPSTDAEISFKIYDTNFSDSNFIYSSKTESDRKPYLKKTKYFNYAGRQWLIIWESNRNFKNNVSQGQAGFILFFGFFASLSLALLLLNLNTTNDRALKLASTVTQQIEERNGLLEESNEALAKELYERQRAEALIREVSKRNELILNTMHEGIFGFNANHQVEFINPAAAEMLGCSVNEILQMSNTHDIFHHTKPDGSPYPKNECSMYQAAINGTPAKIENELFWRKDGTSFPVEYSVTPVRHDGVSEGVVVVFRDISEKMEQDKLLRQAALRFEAIFNQSFQFIGLMSPEGILLEANQSALEAAATEAKDVMGKFFWDTPWWSHSPALQEQLKDAIKRASQNEFVRFEATHPSADGNTITVDFSLKPMLDHSGVVSLLIPEGRDITYTKKIEEEHKQMLEQLREVARMRRNFVSTLTHDLRTPLIAQGRVLSRLQNEGAISSNTSLTSLVKGFLQNNADLLQMVNNLLETYELEDGRIIPLPEAVSLYQVTMDCCHELQELLNAKELEVKNNINPEFPAIQADALLLKRLFKNLLGNAIANIPPGSTIWLEADDIGDSIGFSVKDNGPGISDELLPYLFTRYLSGAGASKKIGSGLGLYICKMICELHGGSIHIDSNADQGTTVNVRLPKQYED